MNCWEECGRPTDWTNQSDEAVRLIDELYSQLDAAVGGPLHMVIDDWNLEGVIAPYGSADEWDAETWLLSQRIAGLLNAMTDDERYAVVAKHDGYW